MPENLGRQVWQCVFGFGGEITDILVHFFVIVIAHLWYISTVLFTKETEEKSTEKEESKESEEVKCVEEADPSQKENVPLSQSKCLDCKSFVMNCIFFLVK